MLWGIGACNHRSMAPQTDLFNTDESSRRLHPSFVLVRDERGWAPARALMQQVFDRMGDRDGNFVQQFQTDGFDARVWELYLYATFEALRFEIDLSHEQPDLLVDRPEGKWAIEATTAAQQSRAMIALPQDPEERRHHLQNEIPIRWGSPLYSKLRKGYWKREHLADVPLVFALQSFTTFDSLEISDTPLVELLYGVRTIAGCAPDGTPQYQHTPISEHRGSKTIPSRFFAQPDAEHVSAVLWSNSGTVGKFNRMAALQGLATSNIHMLRCGLRYDPHPDALEPEWFVERIGDREEAWEEGLVLLHNPYALRPLPDDVLPQIVHHRLDGDIVIPTVPPGHIFRSQTVTIVGV